MAYRRWLAGYPFDTILSFAAHPQVRESMITEAASQIVLSLNLEALDRMQPEVANSVISYNQIQ